MGSNRFRVDMPRYVDMYLSGKLKLDEMISREITLEQINDAFHALSGRSGATGHSLRGLTPVAAASRCCPSAALRPGCHCYCEYPCRKSCPNHSSPR
jgi:hypothetical protein